MPCADNGEKLYYEMRNNHPNNRQEEIIDFLIERNNKLADMLCRTLNEIDKNYGTGWPTDEDIQAWWEEHRKTEEDHQKIISKIKKLQKEKENE